MHEKCDDLVYGVTDVCVNYLGTGSFFLSGVKWMEMANEFERGGGIYTGLWRMSKRIVWISVRAMRVLCIWKNYGQLRHIRHSQALKAFPIKLKSLNFIQRLVVGSYVCGSWRLTGARYLVWSLWECGWWFGIEGGKLGGGQVITEDILIIQVRDDENWIREGAQMIKRGKEKWKIREFSCFAGWFYWFHEGQLTLYSKFCVILFL